MTNGDGQDLSGDTGIPDDQAPVPTDDSEATLDHPLADNQFDFGEFIERLQISAQRLRDAQSILIVLVAVTSIWLLWDLLMAGVRSVGYLLEIGFLVDTLSIPFQLAFIPVVILVAGYQATLYKPYAEKLFDGTFEAGDPMELAKGAIDDLVKALIATVCVMIPIMFTICCPPLGLVVAFVFGQVPYLVVVRDRDLGEAFTDSIERVKNYWHVLLMAAIFMFAAVCVAVVPALCVFGVGWAGGEVATVLNYLLMPFANWVLGVLITVAGFIISTTAFATIDELEGLGTMDPDLE